MNVTLRGAINFFYKFDSFVLNGSIIYYEITLNVRRKYVRAIFDIYSNITFNSSFGYEIS